MNENQLRKIINICQDTIDLISTTINNENTNCIEKIAKNCKVIIAVCMQYKHLTGELNIYNLKVEQRCKLHEALQEIQKYFSAYQCTHRSNIEARLHIKDRLKEIDAILNDAARNAPEKMLSRQIAEVRSCRQARTKQVKKPKP